MSQSIRIWGVGSNAARRRCPAVPFDLPKPEIYYLALHKKHKRLLSKKTAKKLKYSYTSSIHTRLK